MATVDDLLRQLHRRVARLGTRDGHDPSVQFASHLRGWRQLASQSQRTLGYLRPQSGDRELSRLLDLLARGISGTPAVASTLTAVALPIGAIGDLLAGAPRAIDDATSGDCLRLRANLHAALHAVARATLALGRAARRADPKGVLERLANATELASLLPPPARASSLDRLTAARHSPATLDGAVGLWEYEARRVLGNRVLVTGVVLTDTAATLAVLCAAASRQLANAAGDGRVSPATWLAVAGQLDEAASTWRGAAVWPANVQLGGRQPDYRLTTKRVRDALRGPRFGYLPRQRRLRVLRDALAVAQGVGQLQAHTVEQLANRRGLWVTHARANLRPAGMRQRAGSRDWGRLEWGHPERQQLVDTVQAAERALRRATAGLDALLLAAPAVDCHPARLVLIEGCVTSPVPQPPQPAHQQLAVG